MIKLKLLLEKSFQDIYKSKNKWIQLLQRGERKELQDNLWVLIGNAYGPLGGHAHVKNISTILNPELTYWEAIDDDKDPEADAVLFGRKTKLGIKMIGIGHDGKSRSKADVVSKMVKQLGKPGYYAETSGAVTHILHKNGAPYVKDEKKIKQAHADRDVKWLNDKGSYLRNSTNAPAGVPRTMFGNPK